MFQTFQPKAHLKRSVEVWLTVVPIYMYILNLERWHSLYIYCVLESVLKKNEKTHTVDNVAFIVLCEFRIDIFPIYLYLKYKVYKSYTII